MIVRNALRLLFWHNGLLASYFAIAPGTTLSLILAFAASRVLHVAAFFVPLKILLLVTSAGVPSYFASFIAPEDKTAWVAGLTVAVAAAYILSVYLSFATRSIARVGATWVDRYLSGHPTGQPAEDLVAGYGRVCESYGDLLFFGAAFSVGVYFNPALFVSFVSVLLLEAIVCGLALHRYLSQRQEGIEIVYDRLPRAAGIYASANFLIGFTILLLQFLYSRPVNILVGILSIFLMRQMLSALTRYSLHGNWLWQRRDELDVRPVAAKLRRRQLPRQLNLVRRHLRPRHYKETLTTRLAKAGISPITRLTSTFLDSRMWDCAVVRTAARTGSASTDRIFVERIYLAQGADALRQEDICLYHVPELGRWIGQILSTETSSRLASRLSELPLDRPAPPSEAKEVLEAVYRRLWLIRPSAELCRISESSQPALAAQLGVAPLELLLAAGASREDRTTVDDLAANLGAAQDHLRSLPLYVGNARLGRATVFLDAAGEPLVVDWTRWRLDPIGVGLLNVAQPDDFAAEMVTLIRDHEPQNESVSIDSLFLAAHCTDLLWRLERLQLAGALAAAREVLARIEALRNGPRRAVAS